MNLIDYIWCKAHGICTKHLIKKEIYAEPAGSIMWCSLCAIDFENRLKKLQKDRAGRGYGYPRAWTAG
jgi:hypothetical protein